MPDGFIIANFRHADGLQEGQFAVGERKLPARLDDLDPIYRQLLDRPITQTLGIVGPDGRPSLTPMKRSSMYKLLSFDVYGTLMNTSPINVKAFRLILEEAGASNIDALAFYQFW